MKLAFACVMLLACGGEGDAIVGTFSLAWQVTSGGVPIECTTAGIETIQVVTDNGVTTTETYFCTDGEALSGPREPGTYTVRVNALDAADAVVVRSSDQGSILAGQTTDLGVFPLETDPDVCDSSTCPTGCCDAAGSCVDPITDAQCGLGGTTCSNCEAAGLVCNQTDGICAS